VSVRFRAPLNGDHAYSFEIGEVAPETKKITSGNQRIIIRCVREFKIGNRVEDAGVMPSKKNIVKVSSGYALFEN
jgi:hypothetical protein